jgi:hypothetical protein
MDLIGGFIGFSLLGLSNALCLRRILSIRGTRGIALSCGSDSVAPFRAA